MNSQEKIIIMIVLIMILFGIAPLVCLLIDSIMDLLKINRKMKAIQKEINELINKI